MNVGPFDLLTYKSRTFRCGFCLASRVGYTIFTSIVTPDGRLRFVRASMTFGLGDRMSMRRLWMRISNCSRASLWTNVERFTKIFPKDYKRVLEAQRDAVERGVDVDEAVMAAARG